MLPLRKGKPSVWKVRKCLEDARLRPGKQTLHFVSQDVTGWLTQKHGNDLPGTSWTGQGHDRSPTSWLDDTPGGPNRQGCW